MTSGAMISGLVKIALKISEYVAVTTHNKIRIKEH